MHGVLAAVVHPPRGLAAGASAAVFELAVAMAPGMGRVLARHPRCHINVHVGDIEVDSAAPPLGPRWCKP